MKVSIYKDERYPDFGISLDPKDEYLIEIPYELYERHKDAVKEYDAVQRELFELHSKAREL